MSKKSALSFPVIVQNVPKKGLEITISTNETERAQLAATHGLNAVNAFSAKFLLTQWKKDGIKLRGRIDAQIVQTCSVSLEPIEATIAEDVDTIFVPESSRLARIQLDDSGEMLIDADGPDAPETFEGDRIDIWAVAEEFFDLAIDPYPRKPGLEQAAGHAEVFAEEEEEEKPVSPFARLADWQDKT